jgi:hypothetical protein
MSASGNIGLLRTGWPLQRAGFFLQCEASALTRMSAATMPSTNEITIVIPSLFPDTLWGSACLTYLQVVLNVREPTTFLRTQGAISLANRFNLGSHDDAGKYRRRNVCRGGWLECNACRQTLDKDFWCRRRQQQTCAWPQRYQRL